jgi:hypothetical protein
METPLAQQSSESVFAKEELIVAFLQEAFPNLDLTPGTVLRDILVRMYAHLETRIQEQIDLALISSSLLEISKNPDAADKVQVDRLLSNYNITRSEGSTATGKLRLFFSSAESIIIPANTEIYINGVLFNPTESFLLVSANLFTAAPGQRIISPSGSIFTTTIDVTAAAPGSKGNVRTGAILDSITPTPGTVISGKADSDFTGGADEDDNQALIAKMKTGVVGKVFGGREHIKAKLKAQFSGVLDVGCVGFLDPEMRRDLLDGVHTGGRVDVFVKSASYPSRVQEHLVPKFISYNSINREGLFELKLNKDQAAGMYTVESIRAQLDQAGTYELLSDVRGVSDSGFHYLGSGAAPAFSAFQTATIQFVVPFEGMMRAWSSTEQAPTEAQLVANINSYIANQESQAFFKYYVEYLKMPNLQEVQAYVDSAGERSLSADMLVHAPIPVMASVQIRLLKKPGAAEVDILKLKAAIVSKFNSYGFGETISGSALIHTTYQNLPDGYAIDLPIHMYGVVINPDLTKDVVFSSDALRPINNAAKGVSGKNSCFFLETNLVDISVRECG